MAAQELLVIDPNHPWKQELANSSTVPADAGGKVLVAQGTTAAPAYKTIGGDATLAADGTLTVGAAAIGPTKLGAVADGTTLDQSGAGSTLEVKSGGIGATQLASGAVTGVKIAAAAVDGTKLSNTATVRRVIFTGHNNAGACTATGLRVGDVVIGTTNLSDLLDAKASFETTITVNDQIQQSSASDLSTKKFDVLVLAKS